MAYSQWKTKIFLLNFSTNFLFNSIYFQVEDFNWNLRLFLDVLSKYQTKVNKANPVTLELLEKTVDAISDLIGNVEEVSTGQGDAILCAFDEINFDIKRTIFCRICKVSHEIFFLVLVHVSISDK